MLTWIAENIGTLVVAVLLVVVVALVIAGMVRRKKKGASSCGCGCSDCALNGSCHHDHE